MLGFLIRHFRRGQNSGVPESYKSVVKDMFDCEYYLRQYDDVREAGIDPVDHYLATGWKEGRDPNPEFCTSYYLNRYPDVKNADVNPFFHYLTRGKPEGRTPNKLANNIKYSILNNLDRILDKGMCGYSDPAIQVQHIGSIAQ